MPLYLKIATVNCRGLRDHAKRLAFFTHAKTLDIHVLCLQETYSKPRDELIWQNDWGDKNQAVFDSNAEISRKADAGTAILLNHPSLHFGNIRKDGGGRILAAEIRCDSFVFQVVNVYAYHSSYPKQKREGFFNHIYDFANINLTKILCGDFNCVENPTLDRHPAKTSNNTESKHLTDLVQIYKMFDCATKLQQTKHTYFSEISSSRIDRIYASNDVNVVSVRVSPNHFSDHNVLIAQVDIPLQASRGKGYWKNNVTCYENETFLNDLETKWKLWQKQQKSLSLVEWWIQVKNKVKKLVIEHSARLKQENSAIENNLKQQLEQLANLPNFKLYSELKKKLAKLQIESFRKKLLKNEQLFQYSNNLATKEFFKQFLQKRQNVTIDELIDDGGISKTTPIDLAEHVQRFYTKLYSCDQINPLEQNYFLNNLDVGLSDQQKEHLQNDLSVFEIETAISQMAKGKAPGPDGLSVEFYTRCWPIVKHDFVNLLNQMYSTQSIDNRTKSGFITLIYKKGTKTKISNYRPISLLNYDLKIFTKCLTNRLKPFMTNLSHENQYAKPGKQIFSIANLLRDLWWDASDSKTDAYFVSIDFKKAFDSIDQRWLSRVLQKMNFPMKFIRTINSLNKDANVRVLVNGFRTKPVPINKGVRQGDPLSLYLFLLAVEPLVATINNDTRIEGLGKRRKRNVKCPSYADDLTLTLVGSPSVCLAFEIIERFSEATGLKLNMEKTQGMMVRSSCTDDRLPPINWQNQSIKILGFRIGNVNPRAIWHDSLEGLRKQKLLVNVPFQTWQAKSLLAKSKLLPQITYNAHTYPLDTTSKKLIQTEFLNYLTNNSTISLSMRSLQRPTNDGGIKFPNPTTYCDLFYISNLFQYFKTREKNTPFNTETYLIEFEIGLTLSKMYNLPKLNHIPHRDYPTPFYQKTLQILKEYEITLQELTNGKIRQIYNRISYPDKRPSRQEIFRWKLVFQNILPNYLKTFNYRTVCNLLPFNPEPGECALCLQFQDSAVHVFARCSITRQIWTILQDVFDNITEASFPLENLTPLNFFVPIQFENFTESIALILTVTNYCIWQTRKKQLNSDCLKMGKVKPNNVLAMIFNHIKTREKRENSLIDKTNYEITKNIRTEVGRILHNLFK